jgi:tRNA(Ile)-lysidine synthase
VLLPTPRRAGTPLAGARIMGDIVERVRETIERHRMISPRDTVLAAVSGGPDSVAMLHILAGLRSDFGFELRVAHLDHRFRGEASRDDATFVRDLAARLGLEYTCEEVNVPEFVLVNRMSKQDAARMLRYRFLEKTAKLHYCQRIATGHTADDQAETVLMRVIRGAGPDGLAGIPPKRDGTIIRPLIAVWRSEIEGYLAAHGQSYRTDASNLESEYVRNRVRNELLPLLATYNPNIKRTLVTLGTVMADVSSHLARLTDEAVREVVLRARMGQFALDLTKLTGYDEALQRSLFRRLFESLRPDLAPLSFHHVEKLLSLVKRGEVGASVELPSGGQARLEHGCLVLSHGAGPSEVIERELPVPGDVTFSEAALRVTAGIVHGRKPPLRPEEVGDSVAYFDWDEVRPPLSVRGRREGDRFRPFGLDGTKSLKEYFIDEKVPASLRSAVPLVCDRSGLLWVVGLRRSAAAPVTGETKTILTLEAHSSEVETGHRQDPLD